MGSNFESDEHKLQIFIAIFIEYFLKTKYYIIFKEYSKIKFYELGNNNPVIFQTTMPYNY